MPILVVEHWLSFTSSFAGPSVGAEYDRAQSRTETMCAVRPRLQLSKGQPQSELYLPRIVGCRCLSECSQWCRSRSISRVRKLQIDMIQYVETFYKCFNAHSFFGPELPAQAYIQRRIMESDASVSPHSGASRGSLNRLAPGHH